jgi:hypothetical protein
MVLTAGRAEQGEDAHLPLLLEAADLVREAERDREHREVPRAQVVRGRRVLQEDDLLLDVGAVEGVLLEGERDRLERDLLRVALVVGDRLPGLQLL